ncbi:MAG: BrnA antitoxin family protein [Coriobacteriales bacterium]|jgi:predicted DNA binding CopG/RHH family protein|nr:BrnA antitoxin family protein [Coriobacteriales bacterium]
MAKDEMRNEYDFSSSKPNPYAKKLKKQITIRLDEASIDYFKQQASEVGIPYQSLINLYLADCVESHKELKVAWS